MTTESISFQNVISLLPNSEQALLVYTIDYNGLFDDIGLFFNNEQANIYADALFDYYYSTGPLSPNDQIIKFEQALGIKLPEWPGFINLQETLLRLLDHGLVLIQREIESYLLVENGNPFVTICMINKKHDFILEISGTLKFSWDKGYYYVRND